MKYYLADSIRKIAGILQLLNENFGLCKKFSVSTLVLCTSPMIGSIVIRCTVALCARVCCSVCGWLLRVHCNQLVIQISFLSFILRVVAFFLCFGRSSICLKDFAHSRVSES